MAKELLEEVPIWQGYHHHHFYHAIKNPFNTGTVANAFKLIGNGIRNNFTECTKWFVPHFINRYYNYSFFVTCLMSIKEKKIIFEITVADMVNVKPRSMIIYLFIFTLF